MAATFQPPQFSCHIEQSPSGAILVPRGELDLASAEALRLVLDDLLRTRPSSFVVDLSGLTFIDSSGLHCLLDLVRRARAERVELGLVPGSDAVMRLFDLTGTRDTLPFRSAA